MTFSFTPLQRLDRFLKCVLEISSWCRWRPCAWIELLLSAPRKWLRRFLLLKLVTVLLLPHEAILPLLLGCMCSVWALLLLRSPHISTKPSTVLLAQLALTDSVLLLHWVLQLGVAFTYWTDKDCVVETNNILEGRSVWSLKGVSALCQQLLHAHHLASLFLLGLLGLEATLVSRWPEQTRRFRTSHSARLSSSLVWIFVLLEFMVSHSLRIPPESRPQISSSGLQYHDISSEMPDPSLSGFSSHLRRALWLVNLWLHYAVHFGKQHKTKGFFH